MQRLTPAVWLAERDSSRLLGALAWGAATGTDPFAVRLPVLENSAAIGVWWSAGPVLHGPTGNIGWRQSVFRCFGAIDVPGAGRRTTRCRDERTGVAGLYRIVRGAEKSGHGKLLRAWNVLPPINGKIGVPPLRRCRQFNVGRQQAFVEQVQDALAGSPAACAVGGSADTLSLCFLAARSPGEPVDNPRMHAVLAQAAGQAGQGTRFDPTAMQCTVYLRRPRDAAAVRTARARAWGAACPAVAQAVFVRADICRRELLVEIESHLWPRAA